MITVGRLKKLLEEVPDDAKVHAYEGEDSGFNIVKDEKYWWIRAAEPIFNDTTEDDVYTEGFKESEKKN